MTEDNVVYHRTRDNIPKMSAHIYPGKKVGISISRCYFEQLSKLGMKKWKRRKDMKYDHPNMDADVSILDNTLRVSIYTNEMDMKTKLHNYMLINLDKDCQDALRNMFPAKTRIKELELDREFIGGREPRVLHLIFDLEHVDSIGMPDARSLFQ